VEEVLTMSTQKGQKGKPDPGSLEPRHTHQRRPSFAMKIGAFAVAAAIGLVACAGPGDTPRAENATTTGPAEAPQTTAEKVATDFLEAYGAFDVDQAITYLADDADISGLMLGPERVEGTQEELRLNLSMLEAVGYKQMLDSCKETGSSASATAVRCTFDFHYLRSDELRHGPFRGSSFDLTVRDGEVVRASVSWEIAEFSSQMWEPFAGWVSTAHPEDAAVMYTDGTYSEARLTEESTRLWEQRNREYVKVETAK
jgi:hypothetical protein